MPVTFPTRDDQPELPETWHEPEVDGLIEGAVDLHVHPFPSPFPRRMGIVEATEDAVDLALNLGGKIVWFPTISSHAHLDHLEEGGTFPNATITLRHPQPISILNEAGQVKPEVFDILEQIRDHDAILTGGHLPASEIDILFTEAQRIGVQRILVNHPNFIVGASPELAGEWARKGVYIEHSVGMYDTFFGTRKKPIEFSVLEQYIAAAGVGKTMLVSDTGQQNNPRPVDVIKIAIRQLLDRGYDDKSIKSMVGGNAGQLLLG
jgi:hypothetical protein